jgi:uncharacterized hydrophobic protein (TIGR00271 family)
VLQLRVFGASRLVGAVARELESIPGSRHVILTGNGADGTAVVTADLAADAVDAALQRVHQLEVPSEDIMLLRLESIGPSLAQRPLASVVWADLSSQAGANARPLARYMVFMVVAGVVAAFGVIYANTTLVVGAMAISPDILPVTATATALVLGRLTLALRAIVTLVLGLACACTVAAAIAFVLHSLHVGPTELLPGQSGFLTGLSTVNISTPIVALAAGIAAMLALETRASAAVGVAISVTTIPASAYLGVAIGVGNASKALGALAVLGINIAMLVVGGSLTLLAQRALARREGRADSAP